MWRQGFSKSDQVMARPLLTPDELRRLDGDLCIIFEKGIKPIKAQKYYYFKYNTVKLVNQYQVDHNAVSTIDRGKWRKYNPYNPYVEEEETKKENTKIESLDDLFDDEPEVKKDPVKVGENADAPMLPQEEETKESEPLPYDIQKELEAKFDELFGSFEDDDNET